MKWKNEDEHAWHKWFAWYPVYIEATDETVWFETIWYRLTSMTHTYPYGWSYEYQYSFNPTDESVDDYNKRKHKEIMDSIH